MGRFIYKVILVSIISVGFSACYPDDESVERLERSCSLDGVYSCDLLTYHPTTGYQIINMTKTAVLSQSSGNAIDIDMGDLGPQGYRYRVYRNPVTNKLTIVSAPGAAGVPYTQMDASLPGPPIPGWPHSGILNNMYDPVTCTFYIRCGYVGGTGWRVFEEVLKKQ